MDFRSIYLLSSILIWQAHSFNPDILGIVEQSYLKAWKTVKELFKTQFSIEDDIHSIPFAKELICEACKATSTFFIESQKYYVPETLLEMAVIELCILMYTRTVCSGLIKLNLKIFTEIAKRKPDLNSEQVCGTIFEQLCAKTPVVDWSIKIPEISGYSKKHENQSRGRSVSETIQIAHITDTHLDLKYAAGNKGSGCREPICCRDYQGTPDPGEDPAGKWGNYESCDIPLSTVEDAVGNVAAAHEEIEYIYMTGDLIPHNIWETTREKNTEQILQQAELFKKTFGSAKIFSVMGNHETHPANVLAPPELGIEQFSGDWLYEVFWGSWCSHFPPETLTTFMRGGFYSLSPAPGLRIIGLNSLWGYTFNWWLILKAEDPSGQLAWLADTLLAAERNKEKVHILIHGPPSETDTLQVWAREYSRLIERFQDTVVGQFVGHTHRDQFYLFYNQTTPSQPFSVAWNGGSVTTFVDGNPNYKIYFINKKTLEVEDIDTYIFNLTEANMNEVQCPRWFKRYSFKEEYNLTSIHLEDMHGLPKKMAEDKNLFHTYFMHYMKDSDVTKKMRCGSKCRRKQLCKMISTRDPTQCIHQFCKLYGLFC